MVQELALHGAACIYACSPPSIPPSVFAPLEISLAASHPNTKLIAAPMDSSREDEMLSLIDEVLHSCGRLDVWVCTAGDPGPPSIDATSPTQLRDCFDAHALAPFLALKYARRAMEKRCDRGSYPSATEKMSAYGSIIVVGGAASEMVGPCSAVAQHAALGVVRAGVAGLRGSGIRINCVTPGHIDIGYDPSAVARGSSGTATSTCSQASAAQQTSTAPDRAGLPIEVASTVGFLASGFSSYITGANLVVDGGAS